MILGKSLLVGLELLVAADVLGTVAITPTLLDISILGLLVLVGTFLGWTVTLELEGHWPWHTTPDTASVEALLETREKP